MADASESGELEFTGKNVDDATRKAADHFALSRDQLDVRVLSEGRQGILGVGAQPARIAVTPRSAAVRTTPAPAPAPPPPLRTEAPAPVPAEPVRLRPVAPEPIGAAENLPDSFVRQGAGVPQRALDLDLDQDLVTESAVDVLETLVQLLGFDAAVTAREPETPGDGTGMVAAVLDVTGIEERELGLLIGRRGEALAAMQYLVNLIVNHQTRSRSMFGIDIEGYRRRRETALHDLALRIADRVRQNGQAMTLEPMPPAERRIVHIALADDPDVQTISIGEGDARKVAITPR